MELIKHSVKSTLYNMRQYLKWLFFGALTGLVTGLVAAAFSYCLEWATNPSSVVVLGKFRRFHLPIFSLFLPNLVFSYIYGIFSMPFGGFFY